MRKVTHKPLSHNNTIPGKGTLVLSANGLLPSRLLLTMLDRVLCTPPATMALPSLR
jgi:hypothetical protein